MFRKMLESIMKSRSRRHSICVAALLLLISAQMVVVTAGCAGGASATTTPAPTPSPSPNPNPTPTPVPGPSPTPTPGPGPSPTPTPGPSPTPSPSPTPTGVSIVISPSIINLPVNGTQQFTAVVTGSSNTTVTWKASAGAITPSGLYTAPASAGTPTVTATSAADSTKSASAPVLVGGAGSVLAQAAAQVTPGQWFHFTAAENSTWNGGALLATQATGTSDNATTWSTKGLWNPVTKEFYFVGGAHCGSGNCPGSTEVLKYNDSNNTWSVQYNQSVGHTYEGPALNTTSAKNNIYLREFSSNNVDLYSIASQSWSGGIASVPQGSPDCCLALEYFPDRNSLITIDNDNGIFEFTFSNGQWSNCLFGTSSNVGCPNGTHAICGASSTSAPWARYDPVGHRMLLGGCTNVYSLSSSLALTKLASAPFDISSGTIASPITLDPTNGKLVSWNGAGTAFTSDGTSWVSGGVSPFSDPVNGGLVCASVSSYNVIMCFYAGTNTIPVNSGTVWLFKTQ